ncbi:MAG: glutaredoxin domain-containing protein [Patescibacteria group bacterium]
MSSVKIYTTNTCTYCKMAKDFFQQNNVPYEELNVVTDVKARQEMVEKSGQLGVPVIDVDGTIVVGYDRERLSGLLGIK